MISKRMRHYLAQCTFQFVWFIFVLYNSIAKTFLNKLYAFVGEVFVLFLQCIQTISKVFLVWFKSLHLCTGCDMLCLMRAIVVVWSSMISTESSALCSSTSLIISTATLDSIAFDEPNQFFLQSCFGGSWPLLVWKLHILQFLVFTPYAHCFPDLLPMRVPTPDLLSYARPDPRFCHPMSYFNWQAEVLGWSFSWWGVDVDCL